MNFDLSQLRMAASYLKHDIDYQATFSFFVPYLPDDVGFLVSAGVENSVALATNLGFTTDDLEYLRSIGFDEATIREFAQLRFTGEVCAVPEGRILFPNEPVLELRAPIAQAQLLKTAMYHELKMSTSLATHAARFHIASQGTVRLIDDYSHQSQDPEDAARAAGVRAITGFTETTSLVGARRYDLSLAAPMRRTYVQTFPTESEAFHAYVDQCNSNTILLVDTHDAFDSICCAINVICERRLESHSALQINGGDLLDTSRIARKLLDHAGLYTVEILVSGDIDEHHLAWLIDEAAPIDGAVIENRRPLKTNSGELDLACHLVQYDGKPVVTESDGSNLPGAKQIFRWNNSAKDMLGLRDQRMNSGSKALLEQFIEWGERVRLPDTLAQAQQRFRADLRWLPRRARQLSEPATAQPTVSPELGELAHSAG